MKKNIEKMIGKILAVLIATLVVSMPVASILITQIQVTPQQGSAFIEWQTDLDSNSTVLYGESSTLGSEESDTTMVTGHGITLQGLTVGTTYHYRVNSCATADDCDTSGDTQFSIVEEDPTPGNELFLAFSESLPNVTNSSLYTVGGQTDIDAEIKVYVNRRAGSSPVLITLPDGSNAYSMMAGASGLFAGDVLLFPGNNVIEIEARKGLRSNTARMNVKVDALAPGIVLNNLPSAIKNPILNITASLSEASTVSLIVDGQQILETELEAGIHTFEDVQLGTVAGNTEKTFVVMASARDAAGNIGTTPSHSIRIDLKKPDLLITTDLSQAVHTKLIRIEGETEPGANIRLKNLLTIASIDEYYQASAEARVQIDPLGIFLNDVETTADDNGNFGQFINLQEGRNKLYISSTDSAGNVETQYKEVTQEQGDPEWRIIRTDVYPSNLYVTDFKTRPYNANAFIVLEWAGFGPPPLDAKGVTIIKDGQTKENNKLIADFKILKDGKGYYDKKNRRLNLLVNVQVNPYGGTTDQLMKELKETFPKIVINGDVVEKQLVGAYKLTVQQSWGANNNSNYQLKSVSYGTVAFAVQNPTNLAKFLSPHLINETLTKVIAPTKNILEKAQKILLYTTGIGLAACGVLKFLKLINIGGVGMDETIVWVCDRIFCPSVPPDCGTRTFNIQKDANNLFVKSIEVKQPYKRTFIRFVKNEAGNNALGAYHCPENEYIAIKSEREYSQVQNPVPGAEIGKESIDYACISQDEYDKLAWYQIGDVNGEVESGVLEDAYKQNTQGWTDEQKAATPDLSSLPAGRCFGNPLGSYDEARCFGQTGGDSWMNPRGGIDTSVRCGCLPGMYGYTRSALKIVDAMEKCLKQAQIGSVSPGVCEEFLLQYGCDIAVWLFEKALPDIFGKEEEKRIERPDTINGLLSGGRNLKEDLEGRYGDSFNSATGLTSQGLVNNICLAAVKADLSLLESAIGGFIENKPVAPMLAVRGSSRQAGFDPFTGEVRINYDIFVGVVPGGRTQIEVKLVCDRSIEGSGQYCPAERQEYIIPNLPRELTEYDTVNQNFIIQPLPARFWFNKVVLTAVYKLDPKGVSEQTIASAEITRHGDLANGCTFTASGISCEALAVDESGVAKLYFDKNDLKDSPTRVSPNQDYFYSDNKIALTAKVYNDYSEPVYLQIDITDPKQVKTSSQYRINPPESDAGKDMYFNLYLATIGKVKQTSEYIGNYDLNPSQQSVYLISTSTSPDDGKIVPKNAQNTQVSKWCQVERRNAAPELGIINAVYPDGLSTAQRPYQLISIPQNNPVLFYIIDIDNKWVFKAEPLAGEGNENKYKIIKWLNPGIKEDRDAIITVWQQVLANWEIQDSNKCELGADEMIAKLEGHSANPTWIFAFNPGDAANSNAGQEYLGSFPIGERDLSIVSPGTYNIKLNLYKDTNNNGQGDTELPYDAQSQEVSLFYKVDNNAAKCAVKPVVDIVEPIINVIPKGVDIPVGFNIVDDCNKLDYIRISLTKKSDNSEVCSFTFKSSTDEEQTIWTIQDALSRGTKNCKFGKSDITRIMLQDSGSARDLGTLMPYYATTFEVEQTFDTNEDEEFWLRVETSDLDEQNAPRQLEQWIGHDEKDVTFGQVTADEMRVSPIPVRIEQPSDTTGIPTTTTTIITTTPPP